MCILIDDVMTRLDPYSSLVLSYGDIYWAIFIAYYNYAGHSTGALEGCVGLNVKLNILAV